LQRVDGHAPTWLQAAPFHSQVEPFWQTATARPRAVSQVTIDEMALSGPSVATRCQDAPFHDHVWLVVAPAYGVSTAITKPVTGSMFRGTAPTKTS
jgi:hypothetical protein